MESKCDGWCVRLFSKDGEPSWFFDHTFSQTRTKALRKFHNGDRNFWRQVREGRRWPHGSYGKCVKVKLVEVSDEP